MTEHTTSYYAASANKYEPFPTLEESINCDVCVVGGGYTAGYRPSSSALTTAMAISSLCETLPRQPAGQIGARSVAVNTGLKQPDCCSK